MTMNFENHVDEMIKVSEFLWPMGSDGLMDSRGLFNAGSVLYSG